MMNTRISVVHVKNARAMNRTPNNIFIHHIRFSFKHRFKQIVHVQMDHYDVQQISISNVVQHKFMHWTPHSAHVLVRIICHTTIVNSTDPVVLVHPDKFFWIRLQRNRHVFASINVHVNIIVSSIWKMKRLFNKVMVVRIVRVRKEAPGHVRR